MTVGGKELMSDKGAALLKECAAIDKALNGGLYAAVDATELAAGDMVGAIEACSALAFLRPRFKLAVCASCGRKSKASADKCEHCKSPKWLPAQ